jgi:protein-L-isoaspartate(D-aspartate) O-methyltransferase
MFPGTMAPSTNRRDFLLWSAAAVAASLVPSFALADVPSPYDWNAAPPTDSRADYIAWMVKNRGEDPHFLAQRYDRLQDMVARHDVWEKRDVRAFLLTPREEFVTKANLGRAYVGHYLDIGFGVSITGENTVARMTNSLDLRFGEKVLEIGTGSGYQSAFLSNLTDKVWSIEIITALHQRTRGIRDGLIARGYAEYKVITTKNADGYYGWPEAAPFDKIIVTCGIDHIPPPLLKQLQPNGIIVIPVGPPGAQHVLKVTKKQVGDGTFNVARSDIYNGKLQSFVPFTKLEGGVIKGTHNL